MSREAQMTQGLEGELKEYELRDGEQDPQPDAPKLSTDTLSVIIRFYKMDRLPLLDEALFSLALQYWQDLEVIVVVQNGTKETIDQITGLIHGQPWIELFRHKVVAAVIPEGTDGRSILLNRGIQEAEGRYLAFLDDDDLIYQHGYPTLIERLKSGGCAIAVGGSRVAYSRRESDHWFVTAKKNPFEWGKTRLDLLRDNFVPIHSYVIDRERVNASELRFDESFTLLEDYEFLLRLCALYDFDFSSRDVPVCEYRIRDDGSNSMPSSQETSPAAREALERARSAIEARKKGIRLIVSARELEDIRERIDRFDRVLEAERARFDSVLEAERSIYRNSVAYKVAWQVNKILSRNPRLERAMNRILAGTWNRFKGLRAALFSGNISTSVSKAGSEQSQSKS
jgi:glycosyltransferase involved in cell wall biosynthesis